VDLVLTPLCSLLQGRNTPIKFKGDESSPNIMDRWILSFTQSLLLFVRREMTAYRLYTVVPRLIKFIDNLTNWYVRMNRKRFKVREFLSFESALFVSR
jgi:isoleucyl-tRNA synthetase